MSNETNNPPVIIADKSWATWIIIGINVFIYLIMMDYLHFALEDSRGIWIQWGALHPTRVWLGEIWRFVTAIFLHGNLFHLLLNCLVLFQVGRLLESIIGHSRFLFIFIVSGVTGFAASLLVHPSLAIGSSGAVFGIVGALLALLLTFPKEVTDKKLLNALLWFVGINILFGVVFNFGFGNTAIIDNVAHVGGLIAGFLLGISFGIDTPWQKKFYNGKKRLIISYVSLITCYVMLFASVGLAIRPNFSPNYYYQMGLYHLWQKNIEKADKFAGLLDKKTPEDLRTQLLLGKIAAQKNNDENAKKWFSKLVSDPNNLTKVWQINFRNSYQEISFGDLLFIDEKANKLLCQEMLAHDKSFLEAEMLNDCAWLMLMAKNNDVKDKQQALQWIKMATHLSDTIKPEVLHTLAEAYVQNGQISEALVALERAILENPKQARFFQNEKGRIEKLASKSK